MITLKQYDTGRPIAQTLTLNGSPINLTGAAVSLLWRNKAQGSTTSVRLATIVSASAGTVSYTPVAADVATAGDFELEWKIVFPNSTRITVPTEDRILLRILSTLDS